MNSYLVMITFRIWLLELPIAAGEPPRADEARDEPQWGALRAHQIGMATRPRGHVVD